MKVCPFCAEEILDAAIKCKHCQADLRVAELPQCPRCATLVSAEARVCPFCQFAILEYRQNKSAANNTPMRRCAADEKLYFRQIYRDEKAKSRFLGSVTFVLGVIALLIPLVGWIVGPLMIIAGQIWFWSPVWGTMLLDRVFKNGDYGTNMAIASARAQNTYDYAVCPSCGYTLIPNGSTITMYWSDEVGTVNCQKCHKQSFRFKDILLFVPYPEIHVTDSLQEYIEGASLQNQISTRPPGELPGAPV